MKRRPHFTFGYMLIIGSNVASAFSALHNKGYVVGDVNDRNILVNDVGLATVVDTDSFQVPKKNGEFYRCAVSTPEFTPPELEGKDPASIDRNVEQDLFGLGVLLFKLLMQGWSPFSGNVGGDRSMGVSLASGQRYGSQYLFGSKQTSHPAAAPPLNLLSPDLRELFRRCFEQGARTPKSRPSSSEWKTALDHAAKSLEKCPRNDQHLYGSHLPECVWCAHLDRVKLDLFPSASPVQRKIPAPPSPATPPDKQAPTLANILGDVLGGVFRAGAKRFLDELTRPQMPGPEIEPGLWAIERLTPVNPMEGPFLVGGRIELGHGGGFDGVGDLYQRGFVQPCQLGGRWSYDANGKVFWVRCTINGMPPAFEESMRLISGANGRYAAVSLQGIQFGFQRMG